MVLKAKLIAISFGAGIILLSMLCLGAQNLNNRHSINLLVTKSAPLPNGFLVGISIVLGVISGGTSSALMVEEKEQLD